MPSKTKTVLVTSVIVAFIALSIMTMCWCSANDAYGNGPQTYKYQPVKYSAETIEVREIADNEGGK